MLLTRRLSLSIAIVSLPSGSYRIAVSTGSGDQRLDGVSDDAGAKGAIDVRTGSGDVSIQGR